MIRPPDPAIRGVTLRYMPIDMSRPIGRLAAPMGAFGGRINGTGDDEAHLTDHRGDAGRDGSHVADRSAVRAPGRGKPAVAVSGLSVVHALHARHLAVRTGRKRPAAPARWRLAGELRMVQDTRMGGLPS